MKDKVSCENLSIKWKNIYHYVPDNFFTGTKDNIGHLMNNNFFEIIRHDGELTMHMEVDKIYNFACPAYLRYYPQNPIHLLWEKYDIDYWRSRVYWESNK